ncbi:hypothetical protein Patl1_13892 [Pistacia atlantica]|uniref:Uncharacterized protein n=1 Tax=Pistacia atlantica TaxID=434234 RepID=A0ACC1AXX0_9ROSI|nr:hypothetical protein Patl1_13892 [Pistacia atlantica]
MLHVEFYRFLKLSRMKIGSKLLNGPRTSRVFSALASFVNCLVLQENIVSFFKIISCPLLHWLSGIEVQDQVTNEQLQRLWAETLNSLQKSRPPIIFNSAFLKLQACLLEKALDHPRYSISEPTVSFWNSTYGKQVELDYPQNLLHVLDKLSRSGRINLYTRNQPLLKRCHSGIEDTTAPQKYKVTATHNRSSKRVELIEEMINITDHRGQLCPSPKRMRLILTEHQKEVRRAQQGREWDCGGHGPGIRTYTSVDFSQGNDESQETQDY